MKKLWIPAGAMLAATIGGANLQGQDKPPATAPGPIGQAVAGEVKSLTADDFPERQAALKRLESLIADQVRQRAEIQQALQALQQDLATQEKALAMVSGEEAQARIAGLLEMERGLANWTEQTMGEPIQRRQHLLDWGMTPANTLILAKVYSQNKRVRLDGIKSLAEMTGDATNWTLSRLINDADSAVRAAAMSAVWSRPADTDIVSALWFRALTGPQATAEQQGMRDDGRLMGVMSMLAGEDSQELRVDFPDGDPLMFPVEETANSFEDCQLAGAVLVHMKAPVVAERMKALIAERAKAGKTLSLAEDPDWTLVTHRLVEAYGLKEAIPILADEALRPETDQMGGEFNGRPFMWSRRTMAIGVLAVLLEQEPSQFQLSRMKDSGESRGWIWGIATNPMQPIPQDGDGAAVRKFFPWWQQHHAEYGVKEEPSKAGVPPEPEERPVRGRGIRGGINPGGPMIPVPAVPPPANNGGGNAPVAAPAPAVGGTGPAVTPMLIPPGKD